MVYSALFWLSHSFVRAFLDTDTTIQVFMTIFFTLPCENICATLDSRPVGTAHARTHANSSASERHLASIRLVLPVGFSSAYLCSIVQ